MSDRLFKRSAKVTAYRSVAGTPGGFVAANPQFFDQQPNAIEIENLRVQFEVEKSLDKEPNTCTVTITNASQSTRVDLQTKPLIVLVQAGYDGELRYLFKGDLRYGFSHQDGTEWLTELQLADGDRAYRYAQVSKTYRKGMTITAALRDCAASMGLSLDTSTQIAPELQAQFASGRSLWGDTREELSRLLAPYGYQWSIQNGRLTILKDGQTTPGQAVVVAEHTGMIGSPEFSVPEQASATTTKAGKPRKNNYPKLQIKMLLYPELTPGMTIDVQAEAVNGNFRVERVKHTGGTADDDDWLTEIEAKAV